MMKNFKYIKYVSLVLLTSALLTTSSICIEKAGANPVQQTVQQVQTTNNISPLSVVNAPKNYLNKTIMMKAKFDKFSTLGLDYKTAYKSSEEYISFLIKRDDTTHNIPLSEMKLFLKKEVAEKFIDLKTNDEILITGTVFSDALGDAWVDVSDIKIINKVPETK